MPGDEVNVRAARVELARALTRSGASSEDLDEADRLLEHALNGVIPGSHAPPAAWEIFSDLAAVARLRGRARREAAFLVRAVIAAPPEAASELADQVVGLLEADDGALVDGLPPDVASELWKAAHDPSRPDAVVRLAARLALARGHVTAASEVSRQRESVGSDAAELLAASVATSVLETLAEGDPDEAEARLESVRHLVHEPAVALAEALLLYARGDVAAARLRAESSTGSGDLGAVAVIALLRHAVLPGQSDAERLYADARTAATRAARHDPSGGEPLLLRAQVLLEAGWDLDLGRDLLRTALHRMKGLDTLKWWRIQERARNDDRYVYFRVEVAAAQGDRAEVVRWAQTFGAFGTADAQNARLRELWAGAVDDQALAADLLRAAGVDYRQGDDLVAELRCLRQAYEKQPDSTHGLDLADGLWASSFGGNEYAAGCLNEGLNLMGSLEGQHPDSSLGQASLLWGLLLARRDALTADDQQLRSEQRWRALPHLLLAAMLEPDAPYSWAHLAWACHDADLRWPAAHTSRKAVELFPGDDWLMETRVVCEDSWFGSLSDETRVWVREVSPDVAQPAWTAAVTALDLLVQGRATEAVELVPRMELDTWSRGIRAQVLVLGESLDAAWDEITSLVEEAAERGALLDAAWWALLVDQNRARELAELAAVDGAADAAQQAVQATIELVITDGRSGSQRLQATLERTCRPGRLRKSFTVRFPILAAAFSDRPSLLEALESLSVRARELFQVLDPAPPLTAELDAGEVWCEDAELGELVLRLLEQADGRTPSNEPLPTVPWLPGSATVMAGWYRLLARTTMGPS